MVSREHSLTGCLNAALVIKPCKMNNTLSLLIADFRVTVLKNKLGDIGHGMRSHSLCLLLKVRQTPLAVYLVGT